MQQQSYRPITDKNITGSNSTYSKTRSIVGLPKPIRNENGAVIIKSNESITWLILKSSRRLIYKCKYSKH